MLLSVADGIGMGLGFTLAITIIGSVREFLGAGTIFGITILGASYQPMLVMILPPGAFLVLGSLLGLLNVIQNKGKAKKGAPVHETDSDFIKHDFCQ